RVVRFEMNAGDVRPVREPLRRHVRPPGADHQSDERDAGGSLPELALEDVRLEGVRDPAHRRSLPPSAGSPQTQSRSQASATIHERANWVTTPPMDTYEPAAPT